MVPVFSKALKDPGYIPTRSRGPNELRRTFLQTGIVPSATGSAYLEIPASTFSATKTKTLIPASSSLKIVASIQGPKPLPRSVPFSPSLLLTTTVKFAPFATRNRRGYIRDTVERDLGVHLETALRGVIIGERWPKSGVEVVLTVLEAEESGWGLLNVLAGCITVSSAAIADAGIDCVDIVSGGVAAFVRDPSPTSGGLIRVLDPCPAEHQDIVAACVVGYLATRDEITELWLKGNLSSENSDELIEGATHAAIGSLSVLKDVLLEAVEAKFKGYITQELEERKRKSPEQDVDMSGA